MKSSASRSRRPGTGGFTLVEVLVSLAVLGLILGGLMTMLRTGARVSNGAGELQMASAIGARILDRVVASGYSSLMGLDGRRVPLNLAGLYGTEEKEGVTVDGATYFCDLQVDQTDPGLLELRLVLRWGQLENRQKVGELSLTRYLVDPQ